jgi:S-formylglutathione hydrolase
MEFSVFEPPEATNAGVVLYFLSGLTCTWENFTTKAGAQCAASELGVTLVCPDTSPRGNEVHDAPDQSSLGQGASFYVNATQEPWSRHFKMYDYVRYELPSLVEARIGAPVHRGIMGHSMGGHGALTLGLREPDFYRSVSAFSPIVAPSLVPWGRQAMSEYLGADETRWLSHDACQLIKTRGYGGPLLVDQGSADQFLSEQLRPELLEQACAAAHVDLTLRRQVGYDHSYYFISTFIADHIQWHRNLARA